MNQRDRSGVVKIVKVAKGRIRRERNGASSGGIRCDRSGVYLNRNGDAATLGSAVSPGEASTGSMEKM